MNWVGLAGPAMCLTRDLSCNYILQSECRWSLWWGKKVIVDNFPWNSHCKHDTCSSLWVSGTIFCIQITSVLYMLDWLEWHNVNDYGHVLKNDPGKHKCMCFLAKYWCWMTLSVYGRPWKADAQTDCRRNVKAVNIESAVGLLVCDMAEWRSHWVSCIPPQCRLDTFVFIRRMELSQLPLMDSAFHIRSCVKSWGA